MDSLDRPCCQLTCRGAHSHRSRKGTQPLSLPCEIEERVRTGDDPSSPESLCSIFSRHEQAVDDRQVRLHLPNDAFRISSGVDSAFHCGITCPGHMPGCPYEVNKRRSMFKAPYGDYKSVMETSFAPP